MTAFTCNVCGRSNKCPVDQLGRELVSCDCGSTVRFRSVIAALSTSLFGRPLVIHNFPPSPGIIGFGMSDWAGYADRLPDVLGYRNTFFDEPPVLDIAAPVSTSQAGASDFIISTDVLEHVAPPYELALVHLLELLKPGGILVLTVPMYCNGPIREHYPELCDYEIISLAGEPVLVNRTTGGDLEVFRDLVFHGGSGATLEMRVCSLTAVIADLTRVGFVDVMSFDEPVPEHGIAWNDGCAWPILARAPLR